MEPVVWSTPGTTCGRCQAGLEIPVDLPMWSLVGQQDWKKDLVAVRLRVIANLFSIVFTRKHCKIKVQYWKPFPSIRQIWKLTQWEFLSDGPLNPQAQYFNHISIAKAPGWVNHSEPNLSRQIGLSLSRYREAAGFAFLHPLKSALFSFYHSSPCMHIVHAIWTFLHVPYISKLTLQEVPSLQHTPSSSSFLLRNCYVRRFLSKSEHRVSE